MKHLLKYNFANWYGLAFSALLAFAINFSFAVNNSYGQTIKQTTPVLGTEGGNGGNTYEPKFRARAEEVLQFVSLKRTRMAKDISIKLADPKTKVLFFKTQPELYKVINGNIHLSYNYWRAKLDGAGEYSDASCESNDDVQMLKILLELVPQYDDKGGKISCEDMRILYRKSWSAAGAYFGHPIDIKKYFPLLVDAVLTHLTNNNYAFIAKELKDAFAMAKIEITGELIGDDGEVLHAKTVPGLIELDYTFWARAIQFGKEPLALLVGHELLRLMPNKYNDIGFGISYGQWHLDQLDSSHALTWFIIDNPDINATSVHLRNLKPIVYCKKPKKSLGVGHIQTFNHPCTEKKNIDLAAGEVLRIQDASIDSTGSTINYLMGSNFDYGNNTMMTYSEPIKGETNLLGLKGDSEVAKMRRQHMQKRFPKINWEMLK